MRATVTSRGFSISYRIEGQGPPLLLLSGGTQWADQWWECGYGELLEPRYRMIAIDRLGHGDSDKPTDWALYDERLIVDDIVAVLDAEGLHRVPVWGFSQGGKNGASLAVLHPDRISALVHASGPSLPNRNNGQERYEELARTIDTDAGMTEFWRAVGFTDDDAIAAGLRRNRPLAAPAAAIGGSATWSPEPDLIHVPQLWYCGSEEGGWTDDEVMYVAEHSVETHVLEGATHFDVFARAAEACAFVLPFLAANA